MSTPRQQSSVQMRTVDGAMARGMGLVAVFTAISGAARLGQDAAIAWRFGTGASVDAYYYLVSLANWPVAVALSVLTVLMAPVEAELRRCDLRAADRFRAELLGTMLVAALASAPLAWWAMGSASASAAGGLEPAAAAQARAGAPALAVLVALGFVGALLSAWLVAAGRHVLALLEGLPALVLLALVLAIPGSILFWGAAAGALVQVLAMAWVLRTAGALPAPRLGFSGSHWPSFSEGAWLLLGAQALFALVPLMDAFFAAGIAEGAVSTLSYTNRLVLGLQGLAGLALQRSGLPLLSRLSMHSPAAAGKAALRWAGRAAALGAMMGIVVALLADPVVALLFERGRFTAADRTEVAMLLRYGMIQMPLFFSSLVLVTALASANARRPLAVIAIVNTAVKLLASMALVPILGLQGLLVATAAMYGVATGATWLALRRHLAGRRA